MKRMTIKTFDSYDLIIESIRELYTYPKTPERDRNMALLKFSAIANLSNRFNMKQCRPFLLWDLSGTVQRKNAPTFMDFRWFVFHSYYFSDSEQNPKAQLIQVLFKKFDAKKFFSFTNAFQFNVFPIEPPTRKPDDFIGFILSRREKPIVSGDVYREQSIDHV